MMCRICVGRREKVIHMSIFGEVLQLNSVDLVLKSQATQSAICHIFQPYLKLEFGVDWNKVKSCFISF